jgi:hypothetical protein
MPLPASAGGSASRKSYPSLPHGPLHLPSQGFSAAMGLCECLDKITVAGIYAELVLTPPPQIKAWIPDLPWHIAWSRLSLATLARPQQLM